MLLYFKSSTKRKKIFQTKMGIYRTDDELIVKKTSVYPEGLEHIRNIFRNGKMARKLYGTSSAEDWMDGDELITPFYEGETLGSKLRKAFLDDRETDIIKYIKLWKQLVMGNDANICRFEETESFCKIFGEAKGFKGEAGTLISNCDCSCENIILQKDNSYKIIDFEWLFDFPMPIDYLWYRAVKYFMCANEKKVNRDRVLQYAEINADIVELCESMESAFMKYLSYDAVTGIKYGDEDSQFYRICPEDLEEKQIPVHYRPRLKLPKGSRICLYAAGKVGMDYYRSILEESSYKIVAWSDKRASLYRQQGMNLIEPKEIPNFQFDYILLAVLNDYVAEEIKNELANMGIAKEKIIWNKPVRNL